MKFTEDELALIVDCVSEVIAHEESKPGDMAEFLEKLRALQKKLDKVM